MIEAQQFKWFETSSQDKRSNTTEKNMADENSR